MSEPKWSPCHGDESNAAHRAANHLIGKEVALEKMPFLSQWPGTATAARASGVRPPHGIIFPTLLFLIPFMPIVRVMRWVWEASIWCFRKALQVNENWTQNENYTAVFKICVYMTAHLVVRALIWFNWPKKKRYKLLGEKIYPRWRAYMHMACSEPATQCLNDWTLYSWLNFSSFKCNLINHFTTYEFYLILFYSILKNAAS